MARKPRQFVEGEHYHVYNRGTDKRDIFMSRHDLQYFLKLMYVLNREGSIDSVRELTLRETRGQTPGRSPDQLVEFVCFCLLPNHFHFLLKQVSEKGISMFMQKLGTAYSLYFNNKHERSGNLFQGRFKDVHIETNEYLLHLSAYINLNFEVHGKWQGVDNPLTYSSWPEYIGERKSGMCQKDIILGQFASTGEYEAFAKQSLGDIRHRRQEDKVLDAYLLE